MLLFWPNSGRILAISGPYINIVAVLLLSGHWNSPNFQRLLLWHIKHAKPFIIFSLRQVRLNLKRNNTKLSPYWTLLLDRFSGILRSLDLKTKDPRPHGQIIIPHSLSCVLIKIDLIDRCWTCEYLQCEIFDDQIVEHASKHLFSPKFSTGSAGRPWIL